MWSPACRAVRARSDHLAQFRGKLHHELGERRAERDGHLRGRYYPGDLDDLTGASGIAEGTGGFDPGPISLTGARAVIEVMAWGPDGKSATQSLEVQYNAPAVSRSGSAAPSLTVINPAGVTLAVTDLSLPVSGTAASGSGITEVTWSTSNGDSGTASGTTQWSIAAIPLFTGSNTIVIRAFDSSGAISWRSLVVTRY